MNAKVDALTHIIDNMSITFASTVDFVTPSGKICGVPGCITVECQLLDELTLDQVN